MGSARTSRRSFHSNPPGFAPAPHWTLRGQNFGDADYLLAVPGFHGEFQGERFRGYRGTDQIAVKIQHKDRLLTDPGAIEDVLAVENDVVPFDQADVP